MVLKEDNFFVLITETMIVFKFNVYYTQIFFLNTHKEKKSKMFTAGTPKFIFMFYTRVH